MVYETIPPPTGDGARLPAALARPGAPAPRGEIARVATALPALIEADYDRPVTKAEAIAVLSRLSLETGWTATPERVAAIANALVRVGYTRAAVELGGRDLALDADLTKRLGFPHGTVTPADFKRMIEGGGAAAARTGLLTYPQMLLRFEELGGGKDGGKLRSEELFTTVKLTDEGGVKRTYFREL